MRRRSEANEVGFATRPVTRGCFGARLRTDRETLERQIHDSMSDRPREGKSDDELRPVFRHREHSEALRVKSRRPSGRRLFGL
jgi:hypothetical protein